MKHSNLVNMLVEQRSHAWAVAAGAHGREDMARAGDVAKALLTSPLPPSTNAQAPKRRAERHQRVPR